ncbi:MAG: hypothetical protein ACOYD0_13590, partial [Candidatus Nanopelagicales bacterium]
MKLTSTANTSTPTSTAAMAASNFWFIIMWTPGGLGVGMGREDSSGSDGVERGRRASRCWVGRTADVAYSVSDSAFTGIFRSVSKFMSVS